MVLEIKNLCIGYGGRAVVNDFNLCLAEGEIYYLRGKNGSGKTSICLAAAGVINTERAAVSGEIFLCGASIKEMPRAERCSLVSVVFQNIQDNILGTNVEDELAFALENLRVPRQEILNRIDEVMLRLQIAHLKGRACKDLSCGEKQLINIASALIVNPKLLILDEADSGLSPKNQALLSGIVKEFTASGGAVLFAKH